MVTIRTETLIVAFPPTASSASSLNSDSPILTPSGAKASHEVHLDTGTIKASSHMLSKQDWEELKPSIRHQYLDKNRTLKELSEYIHENRGVKLT